VNSDKSRIQ